VTGLPDPAGQDDVYAGFHPVADADPGVCQVEVTIVLERCPAALARLFALLAVLDLTPERSRSVQSGADAISLALTFGAAEPRKIDLLQRKALQLTECFDVSHTVV
jgi:hypothetical protein